MRVLIKVIGNILVTKAPSEPILAIAAAEVLNQDTDTYTTAIDTLLQKLLITGDILDCGNAGEMLSRLLLTMARDKATIKTHGQIVSYSDGGSIAHVNTVTLHEFLETLAGCHFGREQHDPILAKFHAFTGKIVLNFTHFAELRDIVSEFSEEDIKNAWSSGIAFQCAANQPNFDLLLIGYEGPMDKPFDVAHVVLIPVQIKLRDKNVSENVVKKLTSPFLLDGSRFKRSAFILFMELGATANFRGTRERIKLSLHAAETPFDKGKDMSKQSRRAQWAGYADPKAKETEPESFLLHIRGCSLKEYPMLEPHKIAFNQLVSNTLVTPDELQAMEDVTDNLMDPLTFRTVTD